MFLVIDIARVKLTTKYDQKQTKLAWFVSGWVLVFFKNDIFWF
jgi:hypothetical protein